MARHRVYGLVLSPVPTSRTSVDESSTSSSGCRYRFGIDDQVVSPVGDEVGRRPVRQLVGDGKSSSGPGADPAVQDGRRPVAGPLQHPPQACGRHRAAGIVVGNDLCRGVNPEA